MSNRLLKVVATLLSTTLCLTLLGCGGDSGTNQVTGTVTVDGKPLSVSADQQVQMLFASSDAVTGAGVSPDGKFSAELIPGKYSVTLRIVDKAGKDSLGDRFAVGKSTVVQEIKGSESGLTIDFK